MTKRRTRDGMTTVKACLMALGLVALVGRVSALNAQVPQLPPPAQAQAFLQAATQANPALIDSIRQRLSASGMTPDQIRERLAASGYPPDLLDPYLGSGAGPSGGGGLSAGPQELSAIRALGLGDVNSSQASLPIDTGMIRVREGIRQDSLAAGNYLFGVDVFRRATTQFLPALAGPDAARLQTRAGGSFGADPHGRRGERVYHAGNPRGVHSDSPGGPVVCRESYARRVARGAIQSVGARLLRRQTRR